MMNLKFHVELIVDSKLHSWRRLQHATEHSFATRQY